MEQDTSSGQRFNRWQIMTVNQLGYAQNMFLTFAIATLGYWFVLLKDEEFAPGASAKCTMLLSLATVSLSAVCGLTCVLTRLLDFRWTAMRARNREDARPKATVDLIGRISWVLFYSQCVSFVLGVAAIAIALLLTYGSKLT